MNDSEIEQIISRFKLKDAPVFARTRVLTAAHAAWQEPRRHRRGYEAWICSRGGNAVVWTWNVWRWPAWYAAAAALLLLLNGIVTGLDERRISAILAEQAPALNDTPTAIEQLYVELGRDPAVARRLRMLATRPAPKGNINEFILQKNQLLQATELL